MYSETKKSFVAFPGAIILAIESSCDETAAAVIKGGREILSSKIMSSATEHVRFGGVVPEIASRAHTSAVSLVVKEAIEAAGLDLNDIDAVAVTYGAGLLGALLVGVSYAKSLAYALDKPLIAVSHIRGHLAAAYLSDKTLEPPFVSLLASGGHTAVIVVESYNEFKILGSTLDDAVGEAFDKVARVLGLNYPGGPNIEKLAKEGENNVKFPKMLKGEGGYNFSYSGLKTGDQLRSQQTADGRALFPGGRRLFVSGCRARRSRRKSGGGGKRIFFVHDNRGRRGCRERLSQRKTQGGLRQKRAETRSAGKGSLHRQRGYDRRGRVSEIFKRRIRRFVAQRQGSRGT